MEKYGELCGLNIKTEWNAKTKLNKNNSFQAADTRLLDAINSI